MLNIKIPEEKLKSVRDTVYVSTRILKLVWSIDRWLFIGVFIASILPAIIPFINIYIFKVIIDLVVSVVGGSPFVPSQFYILIGLSALVYFIQSVSFATQGYLDRLLWTKVPIHLNELFLGKLTSLDMQYLEDSNFRDLMERATNGYKYRPQNLITNLFYSLQSFVQLVIAFLALANLNLFFVVLILVIAIPEFVNQTFQSKISWGIWQENSPLRKRFEYLTHLLQGPREFKEIKLFILAKKLLAEMRGLQEKFYIDNKKVATRGYKMDLAFNGLGAATFIGIELFIVLEALAKRITVGDISFYSGVVSNFQNGMQGLLRNLTQVFDQSLYVKSVFEVLDAKPLLPQIEKPIKVNFKKAPKIEFRDVDFSYPGSDVKILKDFSLIIEPGEKIAFVGENGAGKTTIIKLLARFYDVDKGEILIDGKNIKELDIPTWYQNYGVLFQDFNKYEHTVKENIYFGKIHEDMDMKGIINAATSAGAHPMVSKFEKGYEQILGKIFEGGIELSGGQWQKVALSRAFFRNAPVLVLDEPTASIDAKAESEIFSRVERLSKDKTVVIISHRFSTVRNADKIYVVDNGKIVESGAHKDLMKLNGQYANLFNLQAKGYQ